MHNLLEISISIGIISNLDNLGIGVSYGIQKIRIPFFSNILIAFMSVIAMAFAMVMGNVLKGVFPYANLTGALLLIVIGLWISFGKILDKTRLCRALARAKPNSLFRLYNKRSAIINLMVDIINNPPLADRNRNGVISLNESVLIGISLSLNCLVTGLGAGLSSLSLFPVIISVFLFSIITITIGYTLGSRARFLQFGYLTEFISGALLVGIGIRNLL